MKNPPASKRYSALLEVETPTFVKSLTKFLSVSFFIIQLLMLFLPWQQNIVAHGFVTAYIPQERMQSVDAPVSGTIQKWHVLEGSKVVAGDILVEISDIDPLFKDRLKAQLEASQNRLKAKEDELQSYQVQLQNLLAVRDARIATAQYKLDIAKQKVLATSENIISVQATLDAAQFQLKRMQRLLSDGLVSKRDKEIAERDEIIARRQLNSSRAQYDAALAEEKSALAELQQVRADAQTSIDAVNAITNRIHSEIADSRNSLAAAETNLSRQKAQMIRAPRNGTVFRVPINSQSRVVTQGQPLLTIIPDTHQRAVALMVDGLDAALISPGSRVRLEFEGWPAIQIAGWPSVALGTFGGVVSFVDTNDDGTGNFRIMVVPDETVQTWPSARFLRQGATAKGWILLEEVTVGYEIWRIFNDFPPRLPDPSHHQSKTSPAVKIKTAEFAPLKREISH